jgi:nucleoside-diphosphate-sugar epimerase
MEQALGHFAARRGLPAAILRFGRLFGPGEVNPARPVAGLVRAMLAGSAPIIYGDGGDIHDYLDVRDAAEAVCLAVERLPSAPGAQVIGTGHGWTTRAVVQALQRRLPAAPPARHMPSAGPRACLVADPAGARAALGFEARYQLEDGLAAEVDEYLAQREPAAFA